MAINYTEEDFERYYQKYVKRDRKGRPAEDVEKFWERMQYETGDENKADLRKERHRTASLFPDSVSSIQIFRSYF
jgi:hypothetical protein